MKKETFSNIAEGTHEGNITKVAKTNITERYTLVKIDTSNPAMVDICTDSDLPIGVATDEASAGDIVNVALLGSADTIKAIASETIVAGKLLRPTDDGKIAPIGTAAGSYNCIGIALNSTIANSMVEVLSCVPTQYTIGE
ncbi:MAG: DUF2190 family protein [Puniceicoccales bacterium]|jgi:hypothetical protein|nr:DUF2190 family protein [Puniceicoccales bacterium]